MEKWFRRLHDRKEPPGIEAKILRKMPMIFLGCTAVPVLVSVLARLWPSGSQNLAGASQQIMTIDILVIATLLTLWTALLTISIGCVIVFVMKGPAYVADAYPLDEASRPRQNRRFPERQESLDD